MRELGPERGQKSKICEANLYSVRVGGKATERSGAWQRDNEKEESNMKTLKDVKVGETVTVAWLHGDGPVKRRIMDKGIG